MPSIFGTPGPGEEPHHTGARGTRGLVRIGRFADRRNRGSGRVRYHSVKTMDRGFGKSTSGSVRRVGRQSNRSN